MTIIPAGGRELAMQPTMQPPVLIWPAERGKAPEIGVPVIRAPMDDTLWTVLLRRLERGENDRDDDDRRRRRRDAYR